MTTLSHSASKQKSQPKNGWVPSHMMRLHAKAASKDFLGLIGILRYHLKNQELKIASENPPTEKESLALAKTFIRLHKDWDRHNSRLHPPVSQEAYEQKRRAQKQANPIEMEEKTQAEALSAEPIIESSSLLPQADEENPLHPIQNSPKADTLLHTEKRKYCFLLPLTMQDSQSIAKERPWLKARYIVCENIDTQIAPSYNRWIVA